MAWLFFFFSFIFFFSLFYLPPILAIYHTKVMMMLYVRRLSDSILLVARSWQSSNQLYLLIGIYVCHQSFIIMIFHLVFFLSFHFITFIWYDDIRKFFLLCGFSVDIVVTSVAICSFHQPKTSFFPSDLKVFSLLVLCILLQNKNKKTSKNFVSLYFLHHSVGPMLNLIMFPFNWNILAASVLKKKFFRFNAAAT